MRVGAGESHFVVADDDFPKAAMVEKRYKSFKPSWAVVTKFIDGGIFFAKVVGIFVEKCGWFLDHEFRKTLKKEYW